MNKFTKLISDNSNQTLARRANSIATTAQIAQQNVVNELKQKKCELEMTISNLTDFAPNTTDSLRPGEKDWNAKEWATKLQKAKQDLYMLEIQINLAQKTYDEYFTDEA